MTQPVQTATSDPATNEEHPEPVEDVGTPFGLYRLSPRETQVAILTAEGHSADDLATSLGIRVGTVRNIRQALRRKLDVPPSTPLNEALTGVFGTVPKDDNPAASLLGAIEGVAKDKLRDKDRRVHLSVRQAISSVGELAERLNARSMAVAAAAQHSRKSGDRLLWEADQLRTIAADLHGLEEQAIARVRAHLASVAG